MFRSFLGFLVIILTAVQLHAAYILIPMDEVQRNHLKAYGITYWVLEHETDAWWLLNYRGGSFAFVHTPLFERECIIRDVSYQVIPDAQFNRILAEINHPEANMEAIKLEVPPKIAVYTPAEDARGEKIEPWDDAVTLVLTYAEIPYDVIYDREILNGELVKYDWLHLHHEDFTGQYGKFYRAYHNHAWYQNYVARMEKLAAELGFDKVSLLKLAVVKQIKQFVGAGGFMFAMCAATDTYDIALAAEGVDIVHEYFDGDPMDPNADEKLDFSRTFAFRDFTLVRNPLEYEFSSIDNTQDRQVRQEHDYFTLFEFSAKWDPVPTMLTQNHTRVVKGFMGQTTAFKKQYIKPNVTILGENRSAHEARYIHGTFGMGTWTFYAGHDPEDYRHFVNDPPTDLNLHPNSPGYRLILNNVLFPAAKKKKQKT